LTLTNSSSFSAVADRSCNSVSERIRAKNVKSQNHIFQCNAIKNVYRVLRSLRTLIWQIREK
jgi:sulfur relay (sulfurtransferase) DsrF/TusC family protein